MTANHLLKPRDYQLECIREINKRWDAGTWRPTAVLPTGAGKTVIFAHLADQWLSANRGKRVLVLAHTDELVQQAVNKLRQVAPRWTVGVVKAQRNEVSAQVIVASVATLRTARRREALRGIGMIIVDECHHATARTYRTILEHFGALAPIDADESWVPRIPVVGFTATLTRGDKAKLSDVWEDVAYRKDLRFMIRRGYLLDVRGRRVVVPDLDLSTVRTSGGDFAEGALGTALTDSLAPELVARAYIEHAGDRKGLLFAPTVAAAEVFAEAFRAEGIATEVVHGGLDRGVRAAILARLHTGETRVVCNCVVLTEGFDEPSVSCVVIARPTKSGGLYQQMVGRVLRPDLTLPADQRGEALILDVVGASRKHDLRSLVDLSSRDGLPDLDQLPELEQMEELSLLELDQWFEEEAESGGAPPYPGYLGPVDVEEFDPLIRDSSRAWGRTTGGVYWMSVGTDRYVFLADSLAGEPGSHDVVWCTKKFARGSSEPQAGMTEYRGLSLEVALAWAEDFAIEEGGYGAKTLTARNARWRKGPPTSGQVAMASRLAIAVPRDGEGRVTVSKGDLADLIDGRQATNRIDPLVRAVKGNAREKK